MTFSTMTGLIGRLIAATSLPKAASLDWRARYTGGVNELSVEVLLGLGVIGIVIAKLTSRRVSHFVSRLFVSETKRQLQSFNVLFDSRGEELNALLEQVTRVYQQTPGKDEERVPDSSVVEESLRVALDRLLESSIEFQDYIQAEGLDRSYFALAPAANLLRVRKPSRKPSSIWARA